MIKKLLFQESLGQLLPNIIFYGLIVLLIVFVKNSLEWDILGMILLIVFLTLVIVGIIRFLILLATTSILIFSKEIALEDKKYDILIIFIDFIENSVFVFYTVYLFNGFKFINLE